MEEKAIAPTDPWLLGWSDRVTPSALGRIAACIRSEAMPHTHSRSPFARKGTVAHKFLADCLDHGRDRALSMVEEVEDIDWLEAIDIERLPAFERDKYSAEVAVAYSPSLREGRLIGYGLSREAAAAKREGDEIVGIVDVGGVAEEGVVVQDYKTGWGYVERAEVNWQMRTYSLFMARTFLKTSAFHSVVRVRDNGDHYFDTAVMDELDLLSHEEEFLSLLRRREDVRQAVRAGLPEAIPPLNEGRHCRYCPAFAVCPAKSFAIRALAGSPAQDLVLTPELAAQAWRQLKLAGKTLERYESVLKDYARQTPVPLGENGEILGEKKHKVESIEPDQARLVLEKQYGDLGGAIAGEATEKRETLTKAALKSALKKLMLPTLPEKEQKITHVEKRVLEVLRVGGAVQTKTTFPVTEHVPPKLALPEGATEEAA